MEEYRSAHHNSTPLQSGSRCSVQSWQQYRHSVLSHALKHALKRFMCVSLRDFLFWQVPGGFLAQRYGGHIMLIISFALWSMASLLTPKTAVNSGAITAARVLVGVAQGFIIPSIHTVLSQVSPISSILDMGKAEALRWLLWQGTRFEQVLPEKVLGLFLELCPDSSPVHHLR